MPEQFTFQLGDNAARIYEEQKVPSMFRSLAEATLRQVEVPEGAHVTDIACGIGIVGRLIVEKVGKSGSVTGVDLNAGMIEVAKRSQPSGVKWHQEDVTALPFPDASFEMAFCQQGLQFFPDKVAALSEVRRVLKPDGTLILTVWSAVPALGAAMPEGLGRYVSSEAAKSALGPFMFNDLEIIKALFIESGFPDIETETLVVERIIGPARESIPLELGGGGFADDIEKLDSATKAALIDGIGEALKDYRKDDGFSIPQSTHLIRATA
jgi:ubiquinone/menaquinone biosynthesis C-methylase UbiE